jgi:hypothetical protein
LSHPRRKMSLSLTSLSKGIPCAHAPINASIYECFATFVIIINIKKIPNCTCITIVSNVPIGLIGIIWVACFKSCNFCCVST